MATAWRTRPNSLLQGFCRPDEILENCVFPLVWHADRKLLADRQNWRLSHLTVFRLHDYSNKSTRTDSAELIGKHT